MSKSKLPEDDSLAGIEAAAHEAGRAAESAQPDERLAALEARLASIEPLLEQLQAQAALGPKIKEYVDSLHAEQRFFNWARWIVGAISLLAVIGLAWLLRDAIYNPRSPLLRAPPLAIATFIVGLISGLVVLLSGFIKGVLRTAGERHAEGFLPPPLNAAIEAYQKLIGGSAKP